MNARDQKFFGWFTPLTFFAILALTGHAVVAELMAADAWVRGATGEQWFWWFGVIIALVAICMVLRLYRMLYQTLNKLHPDGS